MRTPAQQPRAAFTTRIKIKDKNGRVVEEKEVVTAAGLLARGHDEGLRRITSELIQPPTKENGQTAIVRATVKTGRGTFAAIGDATPSNVNARIAPHFIRMAETRAVSRALRAAVNIGMVSLEELLGTGGDEFSVEEGAPAVAAAGSTSNDNGTRQAPPTAPGNGQRAPAPTPSGVFSPMTENQRRFLFRIATERGIPAENAKLWLQAEIGVPDLRAVSRSMASSAIDKLRAVAPNAQGNGAGNGASAP